MAKDTPFPESGPVTYSPAHEITPQRREAEAALRHIPGVQGVGEGQDATGNPAWIVYVKDAAVARQLPHSVGGRPVVPHVSGEISFLSG